MRSRGYARSRGIVRQTILVFSIRPLGECSVPYIKRQSFVRNSAFLTRPLFLTLLKQRGDAPCRRGSPPPFHPMALSLKFRISVDILNINTIHLYATCVHCAWQYSWHQQAYKADIAFILLRLTLHKHPLEPEAGSPDHVAHSEWH